MWRQIHVTGKPDGQTTTAEFPNAAADALTGEELRLRRGGDAWKCLGSGAPCV